VLSLVNEMELLLILMGTIVLCLEVAFRLGLRMRVRTDEANRTHVNALQAALLGLLALLLGFTFAMAVSRFDTRKSLVLAEANAIGTVGLRASLLPPAERLPFLSDLRDYVDARLMFYDAGTDKQRIDASISRTTKIQNQLWTIAAAAAAGESNSIPFGLLLQSLNELFDLAEQRQVALENRVPESVLYLLFRRDCGGAGFYLLRLRTRRTPLPCIDGNLRHVGLTGSHNNHRFRSSTRRLDPDQPAKPLSGAGTTQRGSEALASRRPAALMGIAFPVGKHDTRENDPICTAKQ